LQAISKSIALIAYKVEPGVLYLTGGRACHLLTKNSHCVAAADIDSSESWQTVPEQNDAALVPLPYNNNKAVMDMLYSDMTTRIRLSVDSGELQQLSRRELISPVLFAAAALARTPELRIAAAYAVNGERAHGSIDWIYLYKRLAIVVCEVSSPATYVVHCQRTLCGNFEVPAVCSCSTKLHSLLATSYTTLRDNALTLRFPNCLCACALAGKVV
jgi:hypothetical protein